MSIIKANGAGDPDLGFYNGAATQSLRLNDGAGPYLRRTPGSAGNRRTFTYSFWYKRGNLTTSQNQAFFSAGNSSSDFTMLYIDGTTDDLRWYDYDGSNDYGKAYNVFLRDTASWYHIVYAFDTTQSTDTNKVKVYVNGEEKTVIGTDYHWMPTDYQTRINDAKEHTIGKYTGNTQYIDGYLADINFVDGTQLTPTSFGEFKNGIWIAKKYTGSYGTQGFHLEFKETGDGSSTASSSTIGADTANSNHFKDVNLDTYDSNFTDSPENNFCTMSSTDLNYNAELLEGGLHIKASTYSGGNYGHSICTFKIPESGKWYIEFYSKNLAGTGNASSFGIIDRNNIQPASNKAQPNYVVTTGEGFDGLQHQHYIGGEYVAIKVDGATSGSNVSISTSGNTGSVSALAIDVDNGYLYVGATDGTGGTGSQIRWLDFADGSTGTSNVNPESGSSGTGGIARTFTNNDVISVEVVVSGNNNNKSQIYLNAGQDGTFAGQLTAQNETDANNIGNFYYTVPSGYLALCSSNLPEPTIGPNSDTLPSQLFSPLRYTANATDNTDIGDGNQSENTGLLTQATGLNFKPDLIWTLSSSNATHNLATDSSIGVHYDQLWSTDSYNNNDTAGIKAFNAPTSSTSGDGGFRLGTSTNHNDPNGRVYYTFNWKANDNSETANDASATSVGTVDSVYQANTEAGFSIVEYTGTGTDPGGDGVTIAHGLSKKPEVIFHKNTESTTSGNNYWTMWFEGLLADANLFPSRTNKSNASGWRGYNTISSTVFSPPDANYGNVNGEKFIVYLWHSVDGYSKMGQFIGNGSTDGTFVYCGFKPAFVMTKTWETNTSAWMIYSPLYEIDNPSGFLTLNAATTYQDYNYCDFLSNGFKIRDNGSEANRTGEPYWFMAFAESPFKYANAR